MHRRFLFPLAAGVLGLVALAPVFVSEPSASAVGAAPAKATTSSTTSDSGSNTDADSGTDPGTDQGTDPSQDAGNDTGNAGNDSGSGTSATTAPRSGSDSGSGSGSGSKTSSTTCDPPATDRGPAPQVGEPAQNHAAGEAGSVDVERLSDTELRIVSASPNDGWSEQVKVPSGPRVTVRFDRQGQSPSLIRFAASMDERGTEIHIRVTSCG